MPKSISSEPIAEQIRDLFDLLVSCDADVRAARLGEEADLNVRAEVEGLLAAYDCADDVLQKLEHGINLPAQKAGSSSSGVRSDFADEFVGRSVSHYEITERLGGGGMGVVYKARDLKLNRFVALKFLPPHLSRSAEAKARLIQEAKSASALDHPNICTVHEIDETEDGRLFIAMACYSGETLKKRIAAGPMAPEDVVAYGRQMAAGLGAAHAAGIVHRDVKPANVMVTDGEIVKLVDFGLAKMEDVNLTRTGATIGTVAYMSPEQASGRAMDHRTDLWSLGVVLYEMITGKKPFAGDYADAVLYAILHEEPEPLAMLRSDLPEGLAGVVESLLKKDPGARCLRADDVVSDLRALGEGPRTPAGRPRKGRRTRRYSLAAVGIVILLAGLALMGRSLLESEPRTIDALAVLPLANLSGDPGQEYFADGMTEALIDNLGQIEALKRVISFTSTRQYKTDPRPIPEVGRELNVSAVIEGSVRSVGDEVQVRVRLIDAATEERLWTRDFARDIRDVGALQRDIALAIIQEIEIQVTPQEQARLTDVREVDPRAMNQYLLGLNAFHRTDHQGHNQLLQARDYFEEAIAIDSTFARPYAALPVIYFMHEGGDGIERANRYARKALELGPSLSEAHVAMGICRTLALDWKASEASFRRAVTLNPNNSEAHRELGELMSRTGRFEEARSELQRAVELAPLSDITRLVLFNSYYGAREYDRLIEDARPDSALYWLGLAYLEKGMTSQAKNAIMACCKEDTPLLAYFLARSGDRAEAAKLLREAERSWVQRPPTAPPLEWFGALFNIAVTHAALGDIDQAFLWLERMRETHPWALGITITSPRLDPLRSDPRFASLAAEMGMDPWGRLR